MLEFYCLFREHTSHNILYIMLLCVVFFCRGLQTQKTLALFSKQKQLYRIYIYLCCFYFCSVTPTTTTSSN